MYSYIWDSLYMSPPGKSLGSLKKKQLFWFSRLKGFELSFFLYPQVGLKFKNFIKFYSQDVFILPMFLFPPTLNRHLYATSLQNLNRLSFLNYVLSHTNHTSSRSIRTIRICRLLFMRHSIVKKFVSENLNSLSSSANTFKVNSLNSS